MTKIKLCGLSRLCEIEEANRLLPEYIGFVLAPGSRRYVSPVQAAELKKRLSPKIQAVGVFVNEDVKAIAHLLNAGVIEMAQLHGNENESDIRHLRELSPKPVIKAFCMGTEQDLEAVNTCSADYVLLDSGKGTGMVFDWAKAELVKRPYFLAGGLDAGNVAGALQRLKPYAVDVSSGIETGGHKDLEKMAAFVAAVRKEKGK